MLADEFSSGRIQVEGKRVLELSAGLGLPGVTAKSMGAERVLLTEVHMHAHVALLSSPPLFPTSLSPSGLGLPVVIAKSAECVILTEVLQTQTPFLPPSSPHVFSRPER